MQAASAPPPGDPRFARRPLLDDPLDAALPADHPLAGRAAIALDALADETWVGPSPATSCLEVTLAGCAAAGCEARPTVAAVLEALGDAAAVAAPRPSVAAA